MVRPRFLRSGPPTGPESAAAGERRSLGLTLKFHVGLGLIFLVFCAVIAWLLYAQEKRSMQETALRNSYLVLAAVDATRAYVRETLRPRMYDMLGGDDFVLEAMSTSFITRSVMERFNQVLPEYGYRRSAIHARNPESEMTEVERKLFDHFRDHPSATYWQGIRSVDGATSFVHARPVRMGASCLHCHGAPQDAPAAMLAQYGDERGFGYRADELAGVTAVSIPVNASLAKIRARALSAFWVTLGLMTLLYVVISFLFHRTVIHSLRGLLAIFRRGLVDERGVALLEAASDQAEIDELGDAATVLTDHLRDTQRQLVSYAGELEQSVEALSRSKELLQAVLDGIPDDMVLLDSNLTIRMVNRAYLERRHLSADEVLDRACPHECRDEPSLTGSLLATAMQTGRQAQEEVRTEAGKVYRVHYYPVLDEKGEVRGILRYARDVTMEKQVEQRIQQTEKLAAMGQLAAGVAHEINNPIGVVLTYTDLLLHELKDDERAVADVQVIDRQARACRTIVADLLNFARSGRTEPQIARIDAPAREVVDIVRKQFRKQGSVIELDLAADLPAFAFDADRIKQVLLNLLINAHQAADGGRGRIVVRTARGGRPDTAEIIVRDHGEGIAPELIARIFDPFFSTKRTGEGTGLGLSVSYGIVRDHGGEILVESVPGQWTEFTVVLPLARSKECTA